MMRTWKRVAVVIPSVLMASACSIPLPALPALGVW